MIPSYNTNPTMRNQRMTATQSPSNQMIDTPMKSGSLSRQGSFGSTNNPPLQWYDRDSQLPSVVTNGYTYASAPGSAAGSRAGSRRGSRSSSPLHMVSLYNSYTSLESIQEPSNQQEIDEYEFLMHQKQQIRPQQSPFQSTSGMMNMSVNMNMSRNSSNDRTMSRMPSSDSEALRASQSQSYSRSNSPARYHSNNNSGSNSINSSMRGGGYEYSPNSFNNNTGGGRIAQSGGGGDFYYPENSNSRNNGQRESGYMQQVLEGVEIDNKIIFDEDLLVRNNMFVGSRVSNSASAIEGSNLNEGGGGGGYRDMKLNSFGNLNDEVSVIFELLII